jgi:predicted ATP-grasp superfamily ATP-dependent carboligase
VYDDERPGEVAWSRWYRALPTARQTGHSPRDLSALLAEVRLARLVVVPCADRWVRAAVECPEVGTERFPASLPPPDTAATLLDKGRLAGFLETLAVPHPRTFLVQRPEDVVGPVAILGDGAFIKPCDSHGFQRRFDVKGFRAPNAAEANTLAREAASAGLQVLVQEYIPGPPTCHHFVDGFVDRYGVVRGLFARRRWRMHPPDFGNSTAMISIDLNEVAPAVDDLRRVLAAGRYRGVFSAEFKRDPRDGAFKLLEVNVRPWWFVDFASRAGIDVCEMAYRDALGLPVETASSYRVGLRCVYPFDDRLACRDLVKKGQLSRAAWLFSWIGAHQPVFSFSDPWPAVAGSALLVKRWLRKRLSPAS